MRAYTTLLFWLLATAYSLGQSKAGTIVDSPVITSERNLPRPGDAVKGRPILFGQIPLSSTDTRWSLCDVEWTGEPLTINYAAGHAGTDTLIAYDSQRRRRLRDTGDSLLLLVTEDYMEKVDYGQPEVLLALPLSLGDSISGLLNATGKYCDRLWLRRAGRYATVADAQGELILPDGDTLRHVLRLHTVRDVITATAPIDTLRKAIPAFTEDSILSHLATDTIRFREDTYRWYAAGYRYPIIEGTTISIVRNGHAAPYRSTALYFAPDEQELLDDDAPNRELRDYMSAHGGRLPADGRQPAVPFSYAIANDERARSVTVSYQLGRPANLTAILADRTGIVHQTVTRASASGDGQSLTISYGSLPRGQYVLYLNVGGTQYAEKFSVR